MCKHIPLLVLLVALCGCTENPEELPFEILSVETEAVDCLMTVVDDRTAKAFCDLYFERLKDRRRVLKERLENMKKVMEKKERERYSKLFPPRTKAGDTPTPAAEDEVKIEPNERYVDYRKTLDERRAYQVKRVEALYNEAEERKEVGEELKGFEELKKSDWGDISK